MEKSIFEVWSMVYPSLADCIILAIIFLAFLWLRGSVKNGLREFKKDIFENASNVREHLDIFNATHEKSWKALSELVQELKAGKVWQNEYNIQIENLKEKGTMRDERIKDLAERLKCIERGRRAGE